MNNFPNYRDYSEYHYKHGQNLNNNLRGSSYQNPARPRSNQSPSPIYKPPVSPNYEQSLNYQKYRAQSQNKNRPPTPVYLKEQSREELYNKQLRYNIGNKMNIHNRNVPVFPMMDDQTSLASETMMRPGSFRPGSASNPDFMLPKDVQFYHKHKDKIFLKLDSFYSDEKKGIEEMMDECLKSIITLFEEHKQDLFKNLNDDKVTFEKVYSRFSEGVDAFLKGAESRLENNLKAYETRIMKIQEDDQNPLGTHIEKLRLEKEMINSKERIIHEIKQSYEKSTIPGDKQKISQLMVDEYKKKHSANVSNLAQHMQQMIGGLRNSIESFTTFKKYSSLDISKKKSIEDFNRTNVSKLNQNKVNEQINQGIPSNNPMIQNLNELMRQSNNMTPFGIPNNSANMRQSAMSEEQQIMLQNLAKMGISPNFLGNADAYQMAVLKAQMELLKQKDVNNTLQQKKYLNQNYDQAIVKPHINGNLNINLLPNQKNAWEVTQTKLEPKDKVTPENDHVIQPRIRPVIKSPSQKLADLKKEEISPKPILVNKKSVTFNLTNSQNEPKDLEKMNYLRKEDLNTFKGEEEKPVQTFASEDIRKEEEDINEVIRKYKELDQNQPIIQKSKETPNERAKSPILEAKESINQLNEIYANSRQKLLEYQSRQSPLESQIYNQKYQRNRPDQEDIIRRQSAPYQDDSRYRLNSQNDQRKNTHQGFSDFSKRQQINDNEGIRGESGLKIAPFPNSLSKHKFNKDMLKPKEKKKLEVDINRLGEKYGRAKNRPLSQNIKTIGSGNLASRFYFYKNYKFLKKQN